MAASAFEIFSGACLQPLHNPDLARTIAVTLVPGTYAAGTVLGEITSAAVNDVQTVTVDASTHSTITFSNLVGGKSLTAVQDVTPAALQAALNALLGVSAYTVTGSYVAGSGGTYILTANPAFAGEPIPVVTVSGTFVGGSSPAVANVHTTTGVGPNKSWRAYASGNSDGSQKPQAILKYPVTADYVGNVTGMGQWGTAYPNGVAYNRGQFSCADLVGLDTNAITVGIWRLLEGSTAAGEVELP